MESPVAPQLRRNTSRRALMYSSPRVLWRVSRGRARPMARGRAALIWATTRASMSRGQGQAPRAWSEESSTATTTTSVLAGRAEEKRTPRS